MGTSKSRLALWQARLVAHHLQQIGHTSQLVSIDSFGDLESELPLHKLGDKGVFTKALDEALLSGHIDIAVHSLKDVPTQLHPELTLASALEREQAFDVLVKPIGSAEEDSPARTIATGSIRRRALWLNRYPEDHVVGLRGNVPTRILKTDTASWFGSIFAEAGLHRLGLNHRISERLTWMTPAPAQGCIGVVSTSNCPLADALKKIEHKPTRLCVDLERRFMNRLEAGCSSPLGALAVIDDKTLTFRGCVLSLDGKRRLDLEKSVDLNSVAVKMADLWAQQLIDEGAAELLSEKPDSLS